MTTHKGSTMRLEIEITEDEIKSAMERKVRSAIADQTNQWGVDAYIKDQVKAHWKDVVTAMVLDQLGDSADLKAKIAAEVERKLRAQIAAALKASVA